MGLLRAGGGPRRLFVQLLEWLLAPMVVLWPAAVAATYFAASAIADTTFDAELRQMARGLAEEVLHADPAGDWERSLPVLGAVRNDSIGHFVAQVATPAGRVVAGDPELPAPAESQSLERFQFRDAYIAGQRMRVVQSEVVSRGGERLVVQLAEPYERRRALVGDVTWIVIATIFALVPLMVLLVWRGLERGLRPLVRLRTRIEARAVGDLAPLPTDELPLEIAPLVNTLNQQLERVRHNLEGQRRFVADAAHQMRTPLAGLKTQAESALRGGSAEETRERLRRIEEGADRMSRVVAQLLTLARADDAMAGAPKLEPADLNAVVHEVCEAAADDALARQVSLGFEPAERSTVVDASPVLLRELFANLVDNAIRYTPEGGDVMVRVAGGERARVSVEDTGLGIPEAERGRVFDRFYRVLGTGRSGSGLGLAIVKEIASFHRADVLVHAGHEGQGTRFEVVFPRQ